jgi:MerR family transcriptional regulator, repressor of the yfmOP operon
VNVRSSLQVPAELRFRIGEFARRAGATPRLVRYYEELGLLPDVDRQDGEHRLYDEADVERLRELLHVRELLGLSLVELREWTEAERARRAIRERWHAGGSESPERTRLLAESAGYLERQLALVRSRSAALAELEQELLERRARVASLISSDDMDPTDR